MAIWYATIKHTFQLSPDSVSVPRLAMDTS